MGLSTYGLMKITGNIMRIDVHILAQYGRYSQEACCGKTLWLGGSGMDETIELPAARLMDKFCRLRNAQEGEIPPGPKVRWSYYAPCKICVSQASYWVNKHKEEEGLRELASMDL